MIKLIYITTGTISLGFAFAGMVLPVLPTTPFVLLSLFLFDRSDPKYRQWILEHQKLGPFVNDYVSKEGIPAKAKFKALIVLWVSIATTLIFFLTHLWVRIGIFLIASSVSVYILTRPTRKIP